MILRSRSSGSTVMRVGLVFLLLASASRWFLHANSWLSSDGADGVTGLLYGVTIATLLLGLSMKRRESGA